MANAGATCDFSPRFTEGRCLDFCPPDHNALLFEYEQTLAAWAPRPGGCGKRPMRKPAKSPAANTRPLP